MRIISKMKKELQLAPLGVIRLIMVQKVNRLRGVDDREERKKRGFDLQGAEGG